MLLVSGNEIKSSISMPKAINCVAKGFSDFNDGLFRMPQRSMMDIEGATVLTMPSYRKDGKYFVITVVTFFNYSRLSEQNQIWVGMAKETAHQLGTPTSSLMAWRDYFTEKYLEDPYIKDIDKDIKRLEIITQRFSSIGSTPRMETLNICEQVKLSVDYLQRRITVSYTQLTLPTKA